VDDLEHGGTPTRLTAGAVINNPIWHPDGRRVIYTSGLPNGNLFWRSADGGGVEERLTTSAGQQTAGSVSRDGTTLAYDEATGDGLHDIWVLPLQPPRQPRLLLGTQFSEWNPMFSADGRWLAYQSNRTGTSEIYLTSIAGDGRQIPVSKGGGWNPIWSRDGRELYYRTDEAPRPRGHMMALAIDTTGGEPKMGTPRVLFPYSFQGHGDVASDGRFLLLKHPGEVSPSRVIQLVLNWFEELEGGLR
jgi:serine/threonine-protein kinase